MDVFMSNLPPDLTDGQLKNVLSPLIGELGIGVWACQKQRRKRIGTITFLHPHDGEKFLRQHGELETGLYNTNGQPRMRPRLTIMSALVYCKKSTRDCDPFMLKSLQKDVHDLRDHEKETPPEADGHLNVVFQATTLMCGYYDYNQAGHLAFSPEVQWQLAGGIAKFLKNGLVITFGSSTPSEFRVEIPYRIINAILSSTKPTSLTLTLWEPPRFFEVTRPDSILQVFRDLRIRPGNNGFLSTPQKPPRSRLVALPGGVGNHTEIVGQCLVYQICTIPNDFHHKVQKLRHNDILSISPYNFPPRALANPTFADGLKAFQNTIQKSVTALKFEILFQVQGLVQNGYLLPWTGRDLLIRLQQDSKKTEPASPKGNYSTNETARQHSISGLAIKKLFSQIPFPGPDIESSCFNTDELIEFLRDYESEIRLGLSMELMSEKARNNLTMVYKVQVTPTSVSLHGPEPEAKNRILRKFEDNTDYLVRVQFCDEDGQDIFFNAKVSNEVVYDRFLKFLNTGTQVGGRRYNFLGFSHSSLRSHSAWFMAPFMHQGQLQTYFTIIADLGKFSQIYSPARCAARIGQAFSETPLAISLEEHGIQWYVVDDIRSKNNQRIFTDGVGWISEDVMRAIQAAFPQHTEATCFQIRWGGAKGMLALDARKKGNAFAVRPSMVKFESKDTANLEICDMANKPIPLVLNRQMIKILEDMAVPNDWFFKEQNKELNRLRRITATTFNTAAFLKRQKIAEKIGLARLMRRLDSLEIDYKNDRFLCSVVEAVILRELRLLKHKARIPIEQGVTLFGIVDETRFLEEGEVYVTFDKTDLIDTDFLILDGYEMIITRSPALHPGDIQLATNRIPPTGHPLLMLRNCIVFSQRGNRDLPSQLSGGDLDGDIYNAIWDQYAVRNCKRVFDPADYPLVKPREINREVERPDMTAFFVEFMKTDNLGLIATKHMILADQRHAGTVDADCTLLAQLHSTSVDYSKTGVPVDMSLLSNIKGNRFRPDFLAPAPPTHLQNRTDIMFDAPTQPAADADEEEDTGPRYRYYLSDKILGQLYRAIDERKIWNENVKINRKKADGSQVWNSFISYVTEECEAKLGGATWAHCVEDAWNIRRSYEDAITSACIDYSEHVSMSITELEVFTGNIFNKSGVQTRRQRDSSLKLKDEFDRIAAWIEALIRKRSIPGLTAEQDDEGDSYTESTTNDDAELTPLELSIACLHVGCIREEGRRNTGWNSRQSNGEGHLSFKVVAACCLVKELDIAIKRAEIQAGARLIGGGYVGVSGRTS
ncbi:putative RNA dependent RNA polymerase-domain-containing protein [Seiridium cardinale]|uniref:RNA-dependent RNA polymerase n=1 Tax=Seiridium cardinale TaxID=138064 RepID=A0ABR2XI29_9PEZI